MRVSVCVRGEAGFPIFFSDFVRPLTWLSSWECLSGSRHLGRVGISAAAAPAVPRQTCLGGVSWEPIRPSRSGCGSQTLPSCAASSAVTPSIGLVSSLLWVPGPRPPAVSPGAEASSHVVTPPAPSPILARKTPPSHWPDPGAPSPAPTPLHFPRCGKAPDPCRRLAAAEPRAPLGAHLTAPLSTRRLGASSGSGCHRPWVFAMGGIIRVKFRPGSGSRPQREFKHCGRGELRWLSARNQVSVHAAVVCVCGGGACDISNGTFHPLKQEKTRVLRLPYFLI